MRLSSSVLLLAPAFACVVQPGQPGQPGAQGPQGPKGDPGGLALGDGGVCSAGSAVGAINSDGTVACTPVAVPRLTWSPPSPPPTMPSSPADGDQVDVDLPAAGGIVWRFRYDASSMSSYKWELVGGTAILVELITTDTLSTTAGAYSTYQTAPTADPVIALPFAGDYELDLGFSGYAGRGTTGNETTVWMTLQDSASAPSDNDSVLVNSFGTNVAVQTSAARSMVRTLSPLPINVTANYKAVFSTGDNVKISNRWIKARPIRVQ